MPFVWKTNESNLDCGLFLMFHMLFFFGDVFSCSLHCKELRALFRAEIAATLVLSDLNKNRDEVLEKVQDLIVVKNTLLPMLIEKREKAKQPQKTPVSKASKKKGLYFSTRRCMIYVILLFACCNFGRLKK